jgi:DNA-binding HxlR family transcriptional regulator
LSPGHSDDTDDCRVVADVLARIGDKWTVYVVRLLSDGSMRFNEIKRAIPAISQRMLTLTLRGLERDGLVTRTIYPTIPPRVDYELTDLGRTLITTLMAMGEWAVSNRAKVEKARAAFDAKEKKTKAKIGLARVMPLPWGRQN